MSSPRLVHSMRLFLSLLAASLVVQAVDPGEDFAGYMQDLEQRREDEEKYRERLHQHEVRARHTSCCCSVSVWEVYASPHSHSFLSLLLVLCMMFS